MEVDFSSSRSEGHIEGSPEGQGDDMEKEEEIQEKKEEEKKRDLVPAAEGLEDVTRVTEEARTSMHDQTDSATGLDVGSLIPTKTTPTQVEVMSASEDLLNGLGFISKTCTNSLFVLQVRSTSEFPDFGQMSWDDLFNLDLDEIFSVVLVTKLEPEAAPEVGEAELSVAKTSVANVHKQSIGQISNLFEVIKASDLLINSSISEDHKTVLAKLRDQLPFLVCIFKSATEIEEENVKKLDARKAALEGVAQLKAKFEKAKAKKQEAKAIKLA